MRHELIEQLLAGDAAGSIPGPSALDLHLEETSGSEAAQRAQSGQRRLPEPATRQLTAFDLADEDAEARSFARRRWLGVAAAGAGSTVALVAALSLGL